MLKAYASYYVSYLLNHLNDSSHIKSIILFGSVARDESTKESDVDIFIDLKVSSEKYKKEINRMTGAFYSSREALLFKVKGIDNKINVIVGKIEEWKELRGSIESTGKVLYGPYISSNAKGSKKAIIFWDNIKKNRGAFLNKLYGFKVGDKRYKGIIETLGGVKLGKSCVMIPIEHRKEIEILLKKYGVNAKIVEVYG